MKAVGDKPEGVVLLWTPVPVVARGGGGGEEGAGSPLSRLPEYLSIRSNYSVLAGLYLSPPPPK